MILHDKCHTCSLRIPDSQAIYFANTLALTPFPSRIGSIYGSGLFWCKGDDTLWRGQLLTTTFYPSGVDVEVHIFGPKFSCYYY